MKKGLGLLLILLAVGIGVGYVYFSKDGKNAGSALGIKPAAQTVTLRYGSEKKGFLHDPEVQEILRDKYGLTIDGTKMGSLEMSDRQPGRNRCPVALQRTGGVIVRLPPSGGKL